MTDVLTWEHEELVNPSKLVGEHLIKLVRSATPSPRGDADNARFPPRTIADFAEDLLVLTEELFKLRKFVLSTSFCMWKCFEIDPIGGNIWGWSFETWGEIVNSPLFSYIHLVPPVSEVMSFKHCSLSLALFDDNEGSFPLQPCNMCASSPYSCFPTLYMGGKLIIV
jgi:hypothetical protein